MSFIIERNIFPRSNIRKIARGESWVRHWNGMDKSQNGFNEPQSNVKVGGVPYIYWGRTMSTGDNIFMLNRVVAWRWMDFMFQLRAWQRPNRSTFAGGRSRFPTYAKDQHRPLNREIVLYTYRIIALKGVCPDKGVNPTNISKTFSVARPFISRSCLLSLNRYFVELSTSTYIYYSCMNCIR